MTRPMCTVATLLALALLMVPAIGADENPACASIGDSALPPPDWYVSQCSGIGAPDQVAPGPWRVPGDPVYFVSLFSTIPANARRLLRAPLPTFTYTDLGPSGVAPLSLFALDFDNAANVLWAIDSGCNPACVGRNFGTINQATGAFTVMGAVSAAPGPAAGSNFAGLKFDPTDGTAYIATITPGGISELWTLNLTTGAAALRGTMAGGLMIDIAFDNMGQLYAHNISTDSLHRVDKTNGATTLIGPTGQAYNFAQGMDFDPSENILYLFAQTGGAGVAHLGRANLTTGAVTVLANGTEELEGAIDVPVAPAINLDAVALTVDSAGNGVIEPSEMVVVAPTWHNNTPAATPNVTGTFSNFTGPAGGVYAIIDANGVYGNIGANADATCASPTDCYTVQASAATRPAVHWDTSVTETLNVGTRTDSYTLHIGSSFTDVPTTNNFYRFIETIFHRGITGGCAAGQYCPGNSTTREQMAVLVLLAREGLGYNPPACAPPNTFPDVPETSIFCRWIEELALRGVVSGCGQGNFCPQQAVARDTMSVFVLRTLDPTINPPACVQGSEMFGDVPFDNIFCRFIEELARRQVVSGCGGGNYCPTDPVTRGQMGVFLSVTFGLTLYTP